MIKEGKFGPQEAIWLITITIVAKVLYTSPSTVSSLVGTAQWYMTLISVSVAAVGFSFLYLLLKQFQGKDIIEIFEITFGRLLGSIFSGLLALFMVNIAAIRMREFTEVIKVYTLPLTPPTLIIFLFIGTIAVLNLLGLEVIARFSKLFAYTIVTGFIIVLILGQQNYSIHRVLPILGYGIDRTVYHGIIRSSVYGEVIMIAVFAGSLQGVNHIKKVGYTSLVMSAFFISITSLAYTLTFPYYVAMELTSPMYEMTTLIDYGRFLQRVEPIILFILSISSLISVSAVFYTFVSIYCKIFRIQDTKPVILAGAIIVFTLSMSDKSISEVTFKSVQSIRDYGGAVFYIPPLIALIAAKLRKKGGTNDA
jgi:spore germination protein KB